MTDDRWSADPWLDPLSTSEDLGRMNSPAWWLSELTDGLFTYCHSKSALTNVAVDSISHSPLSRNSTFEDVLAFGGQGQNETEDGEALRNPVSASPVPPDWWTVAECHQTYLARDFESGKEESGDNDGRATLDVSATAASNSKSDINEIGTVSPPNITVNPMEGVSHGHDLLLHESNQMVIRSTTNATISHGPTSGRALHQMDDEYDDESDDTQEDTLDDPNTMIGSFHHNGKFKCLEPRCARKTFNRQAELRRHYDTIHAPRKPEYWCRVASCQRSQANGGYPFPRRDKLRDHMRKIHGRS
jgi:hypothetical protein